ncbi:sterol 26-hydroxylase, mitochondrial-like isoform X3 [Latimeria chalumnae]|uniref:sterol 26-hydroxylase, mitochondrial-like isoform X3 n=1 Tax=Latimeria chalumnae TaxID=7897 RepID=UPI0003C10B0A|nr:PREDICTED: sterol 26-hydroxylase, mitochondrial-like isoform X2 [Latimeria chalumnae]|eukprot:XP_006008961.1 PREDICTED: sterol 26-hydroxylase, mitochondrial-like isoform X2 [Latimeria chalumnae]
MSGKILGPAISCYKGLGSLYHLSQSFTRTVAGGKTTDVSLQASQVPPKYKSVDNLPGPSLFTTVYWLFGKGYSDKSHALQVEHKKIYGLIWRSQFGPYDIVNVASAELIEQVLRQEGKYPVRTDLPHWREYRDLRGQAYGIHVDTGEHWHRIRSVLNPKMLKVKEVSEYADIIHEVVADLLDRIRYLRQKDTSGVMVCNLADELYKFGFEAKKLIDTKVLEIKKKQDKGELVEGEFLTYLLANDKLSLSEIYTSLMELLLGGVDTTSNTMSWTLYHLAQEPARQERLYQEIISVCPPEQIPSASCMAKMPYLKAVIKEILRLYPVVPGNGRWLVENEAVVGGYWFPKKTLFHLCHFAASHEEKDFPEPYAFKPERWLRGQERFKHHPFSSIPFGVGVRACVGKRVAELEMYFALSRILQRYEVRPDPAGKVVEPKTRTLMIPGSPINLKFIERQ